MPSLHNKADEAQPIENDVIIRFSRIPPLSKRQKAGWQSKKRNSKFIFFFCHFLFLEKLSKPTRVDSWSRVIYNVKKINKKSWGCGAHSRSERNASNGTDETLGWNFDFALCLISPEGASGEGQNPDSAVKVDSSYRAIKMLENYRRLTLIDEQIVCMSFCYLSH